MNIDQLREFCSINGSEGISFTWSKDCYSYATDDHILVRTNRIAEALDIRSPILALIESLFKSMFDRFPTEFFDLPELPEILDMVVCPECNGTGEVFFENKFNPYVCECLSCCGDGEIKNTELVTIEFIGIHFNVRYLKKISALPGIKFATNGEYGCFIFDDGEGVVVGVEK